MDKNTQKAKFQSLHHSFIESFWTNQLLTLIPTLVVMITDALVEKSLTCEMTRWRGMWTWATHLDSITVSVIVFIFWAWQILSETNPKKSRLVKTNWTTHTGYWRCGSDGDIPTCYRAGAQDASENIIFSFLQIFESKERNLKGRQYGGNRGCTFRSRQHSKQMWQNKSQLLKVVFYSCIWNIQHSTFNNDQRTVHLGYLFARYILYQQWTMIDMQASPVSELKETTRKVSIQWSTEVINGKWHYMIQYVMYSFCLTCFFNANRLLSL